MKIIRLLATTLDIKATTPTHTSLGAIAVATNLIVRIETDAGLTGWGEASPFGPITGDTQSTNLAMASEFGRPGWSDIAHVEAVRALAGPDIAVRLDSNQGWNTRQALHILKALEPCSINYSEQPIPHWDSAGMARIVRDAETPVCADESLFTAADAATLARLDAADIFNIKLGKAGGLTEALKIAAITEATGRTAMIGCFGETRLGLTASAHLAAARPVIQYIDLDSAIKHERDDVQGAMTYGPGGEITVPDTPGLGATLPENVLAQGKTIEVK